VGTTQQASATPETADLLLTMAYELEEALGPLPHGLCCFYDESQARGIPYKKSASSPKRRSRCE